MTGSQNSINQKLASLGSNFFCNSALKCVILSVGIKAQDSDDKTLLYILKQLSLIAGQKAVVVKSKKAISNFKLRKGVPVGCIVTLRKEKMKNFIAKLTNIALPRIKDFRGLSKSGFNMSNHYSFGIKDHGVFLEAEQEKVQKQFGMNVSLVVSSKDRNEATTILKNLNFPIK